MPKLMTKREAKNKLGISQSIFDRLIEKGWIEPIARNHGIYFSSMDVDECLKRIDDQAEISPDLDIAHKRHRKPMPEQHKFLYELALKRRFLPWDEFYSTEYGEKCDIIEKATGKFGFEKTNPIPVYGSQGELYYLSCLRCECEKAFYFHRSGSLGKCSDGHIVDQYELECSDCKQNLVLYFDMYHTGITLKIPKGLGFKHPKGIGLNARIQNYPDDTISYTYTQRG